MSNEFKNSAANASRRNILRSGAALAAGSALAVTAASAQAQQAGKSGSGRAQQAHTSSMITTKDGTQIYYKD